MPPARPQYPLGESPDRLAAPFIGIEQDEIIDLHAVLVIAQAVDQLGGVRAASPDHGNLDAHVRQRTIRS